MNSLRIRVSSQTSGELRAKIEQDTGFLVVTGEVDQWPYSLNIDSALIIDLGSSLEIGHIELMIARPSWKPGRIWKLPDHAPLADISIVNKPDRGELIDERVGVSVDGNVVDVSIGDLLPDRFLRLSNTVTAAVQEDILAGFRFLME